MGSSTIGKMKHNPHHHTTTPEVRTGDRSRLRDMGWVAGGAVAPMTEVSSARRWGSGVVVVLGVRQVRLCNRGAQQRARPRVMLNRGHGTGSHLSLTRVLVWFGLRLCPPPGLSDPLEFVCGRHSFEFRGGNRRLRWRGTRTRIRVRSPRAVTSTTDYHPRCRDSSPPRSLLPARPPPPP